MTTSTLKPMPGDAHASAALPFDRLPAEIAPVRALLTYYLTASILFGPLFFVAAIAGWFRYHTLRYDIDDEGITMRWGILFRREISLTYARIQDIQLSSNVLERWLGLAKIQLQTASGSSSAEMTIEGVPDVGAMRDFLYSRMRGARDQRHQVRATQAADALPGPEAGDPVTELADVLTQVAAELRALRIERSGGAAGSDRA